MSRSDIERVEDRRPFYLYVDEFQNFATDSFATILSEARKYGLNLTVANQYISQMQDTVRDAVFGNVGTMISFRVSADDAPLLSKQFEPQFEPNDLLQMRNRSFIINMIIKGEKSPAFSATTLTIPASQTNFMPQIVDSSRRKYARERADIEAEIQALVGGTAITAGPTAQQPALPPKTPSQPMPKGVTLGKIWPVDSGAKAVKPVEDRPKLKPENTSSNSSPTSKSTEAGERPTLPPRTPATASSPSPTTSADGDAPRKRSRTRSRKKKGGEGDGQQSQQPRSNEARQPREDTREARPSQSPEPQRQTTTDAQRPAQRRPEQKTEQQPTRTADTPRPSDTPREPRHEPGVINMDRPVEREIKLR
jgi:hypothetical protein